MPGFGRFGQAQDDVEHRGSGTGRRGERLRRLAAEPWPRLLLKVALQLLALFAVASLLAWLLGR